MFYLKLNKIKILNNRELLGKAEVQIMSFITTGNEELPQLESLLGTEDRAEREVILKSAVATVLSWRILTPVYKIRDNHQLFFGDAGYVVYKSDSIPDDLNWQLMAVELDGRTRENAELAEELLAKNDNLSKTIDALLTVASFSNPVTAAVKVIVNVVAETLPEVLKHDRDDQVGLFITSLNRREHYLYGLRDKQDVPDLSGNMFIDYSIFGYENSAS